MQCDGLVAYRVVCFGVFLYLYARVFLRIRVCVCVWISRGPAGRVPAAAGRVKCRCRHRPINYVPTYIIYLMHGRARIYILYRCSGINGE